MENRGPGRDCEQNYHSLADDLEGTNTSMLTSTGNRSPQQQEQLRRGSGRGGADDETATQISASNHNSGAVLSYMSSGSGSSPQNDAHNDTLRLSAPKAMPATTTTTTQNSLNNSLTKTRSGTKNSAAGNSNIINSSKSALKDSFKNSPSEKSFYYEAGGVLTPLHEYHSPEMGDFESDNSMMSSSNANNNLQSRSRSLPSTEQAQQNHESHGHPQQQQRRNHFWKSRSERESGGTWGTHPSTVLGRKFLSPEHRRAEFVKKSESEKSGISLQHKSSFRVASFFNDVVKGNASVVLSPSLRSRIKGRRKHRGNRFFESEPDLSPHNDHRSSTTVAISEATAAIGNPHHSYSSASDIRQTRSDSRLFGHRVKASWRKTAIPQVQSTPATESAESSFLAKTLRTIQKVPRAILSNDSSIHKQRQFEAASTTPSHYHYYREQDDIERSLGAIASCSTMGSEFIKYDQQYFESLTAHQYYAMYGFYPPFAFERTRPINLRAREHWKRLAEKVLSGEFFLRTAALNDPNHNSMLDTDSDYADSDSEDDLLPPVSQDEEEAKAKARADAKRKAALNAIRQQMDFSIWHCLAAIICYLLVAVLAFSYFLESWPIIDSIYFAVVTFTTVGYGDLSPTTIGGQAFTCLFALMGVAFLGVALGIIGNNLIENQQRAVEQSSQVAKSRILMLFGDSGEAASKQQQPARPVDPADAARRALFVEFLTVCSVQLAFATLIVVVPGVNSVGAWDFHSAIYYSIITACTVGYGDLVFDTQRGRLIAIFIIPLSVAAMARFLHHVAKAIINHRQRLVRVRMERKKLTMHDLEVMDEDGDGDVTRAEFLEFMLVAMNKVDKELIDELREHFNRLDEDKSGTLSKYDLFEAARNRFKTPRHKLQLAQYKHELLSKGSKVSDTPPRSETPAVILANCQ